MNYLRDALLREDTSHPTVLALRMSGIPHAAKDPNRRVHALRDKAHVMAMADMLRLGTREVVGEET